MKALIKYAFGPGNVEVRDVPEPVPAADEVKVEVKYGGICGTDMHIYEDTSYKYNPPVILGHEWSGVVVEAGSDVSHVKVGDRVTGVPPHYTCGRCRYCLEGHIMLCNERVSSGSGRNGAFAKYATYKEKAIRVLPDNVSFQGGALSEPLACCVKAVNQITGITGGDVVLVTGPGPIGLLAAQCARAEGAYVVLAGTDVDGDRLELAKTHLMADLTLNVQHDPVEQILKDMTHGYGADAVFECAGAPAATRLGLQCVRKEGRFTQIGLHEKPFEVDFLQILTKEILVQASFGASLQAWDLTMALFGLGKVNTEAVVSDVLPITQWEQGFDKIHKREGLKILLQPED